MLLIDAVTNDWVVGATPANGFEVGKSATVSLFEDVVIKIKLHIAHTWGTDEAILEITFPKNAE